MRVLFTCVTLALLAAVPIWADEDSQSSFASHSSSNQQSSSDDGNGPNTQSQVSFSQESQNSGTVNGKPISGSQSSVRVSQKCKNGDCMTCVNDKCFKSANYSSVKAISGCPVAACVKGCDQAVTASDGCPICSCGDGTGLREPCSVDSDCPKNATGCKQSACSYDNIPANLPHSCTNAYECPAAEDCDKGSCVASKSGKHSNKFCTSTSECPEDYTCRRSTCWESPDKHLPHRVCTFDFNCPSGYECRQQTCYKGGPEHSESACVFDSQCDDGMRCDSQRMTCYPK